ncbi:hypothetical protein O6H91_22G020800 [Diphasiastrum complanatum]|uniref:Uncharacterized protein n=2 Tax=Diphasiastrum complanatum TaxID=34168 RepID=A0ACC2ADH3_DIPCM|nr:hypothetical protein O6H91_22G018400 [Diphasiastrum complanatum]KAJ7515623.1 hypothetical protein O6H91_22G020800 [Diphasiastrum complanatum]
MARWAGMVAMTGGTAGAGLLLTVVGFCAVLMVVGMCANHRRSKGSSCKVLNRDSDMDDVSQRSPCSKSSEDERSPKSHSSGDGSSKKLLSFFKRRFEQVDEMDLAAYAEAYKMQEEANWAASSAVWQRAIILGEKCEPPAFSGLILYDEFGNRITEFPAKSPRPGLSLPRTFEVC